MLQLRLSRKLPRPLGARKEVGILLQLKVHIHKQFCSRFCFLAIRATVVMLAARYLKRWQVKSKMATPLCFLRGMSVALDLPSNENEDEQSLYLLVRTCVRDSPTIFNLARLSAILASPTIKCVAFHHHCTACKGYLDQIGHDGFTMVGTDHKSSSLLRKFR